MTKNAEKRTTRLAGILFLLGIIAVAATIYFSGWLTGLTLAAVIIIVLVIYIKSIYVIVEPNKIHVISGGGKIEEYRGGDTYNYIPLFKKRNIVSRSIIEIAVPKIKLLDVDNLPFAVEISCKVGIADARTAVTSLGDATAREIIPIVDDTIQSAARSEAMKQTLPTIMRERDNMETAIFASTTESLARIGVEVVLFDIKNIVDIEGSTVIADMERVKSAELRRYAREAEANQNSRAEIVEANRRSEAEVQRQEALRKSENARIEQEKFIAEQKRELVLREMDVRDAETRRSAEIDSLQVNIQAEADADRVRKMAQGDADAQLIRAQADAESVRLRAQADADAIKYKLEAEAEGTKALAESLKQYNAAGIKVKMAEIEANAHIDIAQSIAKGLQSNSKVILPSSGVSDFFTNLVTGIATLKETGTKVSDVTKD